MGRLAPEEEPLEAQPDEETVTLGPDEGEEDEMTPAESPSWKKKRRDRCESDSDTLEDLQLWQEQEEYLPEVLPPEVLGSNVQLDPPGAAFHFCAGCNEQQFAHGRCGEGSSLHGGRAGSCGPESGGAPPTGWKRTGNGPCHCC